MMFSWTEFNYHQLEGIKMFEESEILRSKRGRRKIASKLFIIIWSNSIGSNYSFDILLPNSSSRPSK